ncbi:MAG: hypothetical protein QOJ65_179 [Fimbriimonadaceae bacterium]|jgi:hypothetical protein|nr:hypothetical protein [Fimbriimonadaceae bacterium]
MFTLPLLALSLLSLTERRVDCAVYLLKDCPIANTYAPELKRIVKVYSAKGVRFRLVFEDPDVSVGQARKHAREYGFYVPVSIDKDREEARRLDVSASPTVVVTKAGEVLYQGRIDNMYASVGRRRPKPTSHDLRSALDAVLAGRAVREKRTEAIGCRLF